MSSFYNRDELLALGFKSVGEDVLVSRKASLYGAGNMTLGNHVRIDDFCVLSGRITIGSYVHIAAGAMLFGGSYGIIMEDYSGLSSRCVVYAASDDYSGKHMTNPTVPKQYLGVKESAVLIGKHCIIGSGSTILPGAVIEEGCAVGAMSLITKRADAWCIYAGVPAKCIGNRNTELLGLCDDLEARERHGANC